MCIVFSDKNLHSNFSFIPRISLNFFTFLLISRLSNGGNFGFLSKELSLNGNKRFNIFLIICLKL